MNRIRSTYLGAAFAIFLGACHGGWALLVWAGGAQWLLDFIFRLHMIAPAYHVTAFSLPTAIGLVCITAAIGYVSGLLLGFFWNQLVRQPAAGRQLESYEPKHAH